jgi:hypothetical protein
MIMLASRSLEDRDRIETTICPPASARQQAAFSKVIQTIEYFFSFPGPINLL